MNPQNQPQITIQSPDFTKINSPTSRFKMSPFLALKKLKQIQGHVTTVKKRYKVIQAQQNKIKNHSQYIENKIKVLDESKQLHSNNKQKWIQILQKRKEQVKQLKQKNNAKNKFRWQRMNTIKQIQFSQHKNDRNNIKKIERQHEQKIIQMKKIDLGQKRGKRDKILQQQYKLRLNIQKLKIEKQSRIIEQKQLSTDQMVKKIQQKEQQLKDLSHQEIQLVKIRQQSKNIQNEMKQRLVRVITDKSFRIHKLPCIKSQIISNKQYVSEKRINE